MSADTSGLLLTESQELHIFAEQDIGSMINLLAEQTQPPLVAECYDYDQKIFDEDIDIVFPKLSPPVTPSVICNEDYSGELDFQVKINPQSTNNNWVFSEKLQKLYILMTCPFSVDFKWNAIPKNMFVRATPLFSNPDHAQQLITRCLNHMVPNDQNNINVPKSLYGHVLRCQNINAVYHGYLDGNIHFNVIVELGTPQTGTDSVRVIYYFVCKNSCPSGMNRKPFEVVFTLEDGIGTVYGRKKIHVKVCSCPKRDKDKEEKDVTVPSSPKKKRLIRIEKKPYSPSSTLSPSSTRSPSSIRSSPNTRSPSSTPLDTKEYNLNISICGKENMCRVVRTAYEIITTQLHEHGPNDVYKANQEQLHGYLKSLEQSGNT